jgi:hypothetical protein
MIVNIRYPRDSTDLLSELRRLAQDRARPSGVAPRRR